MADRIEWFDVSVAAGTAKASAVEVSTAFTDGVVERIELTIPDGHSGLTGIAFLQAHQQVIPHTSGAYAVGNDVEFNWPVSNFLDNGSWSVKVFNTDVFSHIFHIRFLVNENTVPGVSAVSSAAALLPVGSATEEPLTETMVAEELAIAGEET